MYNDVMNECFNKIIDEYKNFPEVKAIALGGSGYRETGHLI